MHRGEGFYSFGNQKHFSINLQEQGDVQSCTNYRGTKLMSHTMKL
jgi:hypothetical protein